METGIEFFNETRATNLPSATADAAAHFRLVANAHLPHFNADIQFLNQHFYQLAKIDAAFGGKEKSKLAGIKGAFNRKQIHFKPQTLDGFNTKGVGFLFGLNISFDLRKILFARRAKHLL